MRLSKFRRAQIIICRSGRHRQAKPLTYVYDDLDGINYALTPSHLINGSRLQNTPNSSHFEIVSTHESLTQRSRHQKRLLNQFTETWRKDYLVSLCETHAARSRRKKALELLLVTWCYFRMIQLESALETSDRKGFVTQE